MERSLEYYKRLEQALVKQLWAVQNEIWAMEAPQWQQDMEDLDEWPESLENDGSYPEEEFDEYGAMQWMVDHEMEKPCTACGAPNHYECICTQDPEPDEDDFRENQLCNGDDQ